MTPADAAPRPYRILYHHRTQAADGQRVHIKEAQHALRQRGHAVTEVAPIPAIAPAGSAERRRGWRRLVSAVTVLDTGVLHDLLQWLYNAYAILTLGRAILRHRPDFIYERYALHAWAGTWLARTLRVPLLLEVNSPLAQEQERLGKVRFPELARAAERYILRAATRVLAVSTPLQDMLIEDAGLARATTAVLPNGVDLERIDRGKDHRAGARAQLGFADDMLVIGAIAFFLDWHGLDRLITAFQDSTPAREPVGLLLVGEGPMLHALKVAAAAARPGDVVRFTGMVEHGAVPALLAAMDIVALPAATGYASPLKLFEYMAAGKAIVAPRQPNITEIVSDGIDVLLFDPGDDDGMRKAIDRLMHSADLRQRLGTAARQTIERERLTWEGNADRIIREYELAISAATARPTKVLRAVPGP